MYVPLSSVLEHGLEVLQIALFVAVLVEAVVEYHLELLRPRNSLKHDLKDLSLPIILIASFILYGVLNDQHIMICDDMCVCLHTIDIAQL